MVAGRNHLQAINPFLNSNIPLVVISLIFREFTGILSGRYIAYRLTWIKIQVYALVIRTILIRTILMRTLYNTYNTNAYTQLYVEILPQCSCTAMLRKAIPCFIFYLIHWQKEYVWKSMLLSN